MTEQPCVNVPKLTFVNLKQVQYNSKKNDHESIKLADITKVETEVMRHNGYVNIDVLCKSMGKNFDIWLMEPLNVQYLQSMDLMYSNLIIAHPNGRFVHPSILNQILLTFNIL